MNIASSLLSWLTNTAPPTEMNPSAPQTAGEKPQPSAPAAHAAPTDQVRFSPLAQKLSQTPAADIEAQITLEERLALRQETHPQTYKPSLMQMAKNFLGMGMS